MFQCVSVLNARTKRNENEPTAQLLKLEVNAADQNLIILMFTVNAGTESKSVRVNERNGTEEHSKMTNKPKLMVKLNSDALVE